LLEQRFGSASGNQPGAVPSRADRAPGRNGLAGAGLRMSSAEFSALLNLAPEQRAVLGTLMRQTEITIAAEG
jgi:hypothetical protein